MTHAKFAKYEYPLKNFADAFVRKVFYLYKCGGKGWALSKKFYVIIDCSNASDAEFAYK